MKTVIILIRYGWRIISFWAILLGILYLPADTFGFLETYPAVKAMVDSLDRETLLYLLAGGVGVWLTWADARPYLQRKWRQFFSPGLEFIWGEEPAAMMMIDVFSDEKQENHRERHFRRVGLRNNSGRTLHNVRIRVEEIEGVISEHLPQPLRHRCGGLIDAVDLARDETEFWDVVKWDAPEPSDVRMQGFFLCFARKDTRGKIPAGDYKIVLAAYSDETGRIVETARLRHLNGFLCLSKAGEPTDFEKELEASQSSESRSVEQPAATSA